MEENNATLAELGRRMKKKPFLKLVKEAAQTLDAPRNDLFTQIPPATMNNTTIELQNLKTGFEATPGFDMFVPQIKNNHYIQNPNFGNLQVVTGTSSIKSPGLTHPPERQPEQPPLKKQKTVDDMPVDQTPADQTPDTSIVTTPDEKTEEGKVDVPNATNEDRPLADIPVKKEEPEVLLPPPPPAAPALLPSKYTSKIPSLDTVAETTSAVSQFYSKVKEQKRLSPIVEKLEKKWIPREETRQTLGAVVNVPYQVNQLRKAQTFGVAFEKGAELLQTGAQVASHLVSLGIFG